MNELTQELLIGAVHNYLLVKEHIAQVTGGKRRELDEWLACASDPDVSPKRAREAEGEVARILYGPTRLVHFGGLTIPELRARNMCTTCGESGFPYCLRHDAP